MAPNRQLAATAALIVVASLAALSARGQVPAPTGNLQPTDVTYGPETRTRYRIGAKVVANGAAQNLVVLMAAPLACPEQEVALLEEESSPNVDSVEYRRLDDGVHQMVISIAELAPQQEAYAYATFEIRTRSVVAPHETETLAIPARPDRSLRPYLGRSPMIDVNHRAIRAAVDAALKSVEQRADGASGDWQRVEALYDYALEHVAYQLGDDKSSLRALADGRGDCQAIAAVFVAMCRTLKVPARMVWVDGHQYAEFYLESSPGVGGWYPVESAGTRAFGEMPLARAILQKGDNIRVPERPRMRLRYASDWATFLSAPNQQPAITYVRERLEHAPRDAAHLQFRARRGGFVALVVGKGLAQRRFET